MLLKLLMVLTVLPNFLYPKEKLCSSNKGPFLDWEYQEQLLWLAIIHIPIWYWRWGKTVENSMPQKHLHGISYCNSCWNSCLTLAPPLSPLYWRNFVDAADSRLETHFWWWLWFFILLFFFFFQLFRLLGPIEKCAPVLVMSHLQLAKNVIVWDLM